MIQKLKKKSERTMQENWCLGRRKSVAVGLLNSLGSRKENNIEEEKGRRRKRGEIGDSLSQIL